MNKSKTIVALTELLGLTVKQSVFMDSYFNQMLTLDLNQLVNFVYLSEKQANLFVKYREAFMSIEDAYSNSAVNKITCSKDTYKIFKNMMILDHEEASCLFLSRNNYIISKYLHSKGGIAGTVMDARLIMKEAILAGATSIILCHNHPSGNINPSEMDKAVTRKIKESAKLFDIALLDHIIIAKNEYYSFSDEGEL